MANTRPGSLMVLLTAIITISTVVSAQAPGPAPSAGMAPSEGMAPSPAMDCITPLLGLSDCLTFVEKGSNLTKPAKGCCPGLLKVVSSAPVCLCQLLANTSAASSFGIQIDRSKALSLVDICKTGVSASTCSLIGVPVGAPGAPMEAPTSPTSPTSTDGSASSSPGATPRGMSHGVSNIPLSVLHILISISGIAAAIF